MWQKLAKIVLKNRVVLLGLLLISTVVMGYFASKVKLSYEFSRAIPTDNSKYKEYVEFRKKFGDDGNLLVIGIQTKDLFTMKNFMPYQQLQKNLSKIRGVDDIAGLPLAINLQKDSATEKLVPVRIFRDITSQVELDSARDIFYSLPFYKSLLYSDSMHAFLMGVKINKDILNTRGRDTIIKRIKDAVGMFESSTGITAHLSGLPFIRTLIAERIQKEMKLFLGGSLLLSILILLLFFRSLSTTLLSIAVVITGVVWTFGVTYLLGYNITLLTALIPSLVVVIGIPNCIYFINKYHTSYIESNDKEQSLVNMVSRMGIVTLFCNLTAAIGFAVFAFTKSAVLKEFGQVAGISIMVIFFISFILLPGVLSLMPVPGKQQLKYLNSPWIISLLVQLEGWVFNHQKTILATTAILLLVAVLGITRLKTVAYIVDDLPKTDLVYKDLKFFEQNFKGVMPLEIIIDTKKRYGLTGMKSLAVFEKVDSLSQYIASQTKMNRPLSIAEGLKFAKQAFYEGDSANYLLPNNFDGAFVAEYLRPSKDSGNNFTKMLRSFMDSGRQATRISIGMADVGTKELPGILNGIHLRAAELFDSSYTITFTGTSITFLEGSRFIINGLKESILWAFLLIALCMLFLFRSFRILFCSLIPNVVPLILTAGIMGWAGVPLKPSTVLIFSVALGIAVDITIRFLVNYKQVLPTNNNNIVLSVKHTIRQTGLSIIYTSLVLIAGFIIFCASSFGGTFALGWLTSVTLLLATATNLILLPVLILLFHPNKVKANN